MFLQDSQIVQLECKNLKDQEEMLKELEDKNGSTQFFLADPAGLFFNTNPLKNLEDNMVWNDYDDQLIIAFHKLQNPNST